LPSRRRASITGHGYVANDNVLVPRIEIVRSVGHHRMAVLLTTPEQYALWLNSEIVERGLLEHLFAPTDASVMACYPAKRT
jgi:hypothetical protein